MKNLFLCGFWGVSFFCTVFVLTLFFIVLFFIFMDIENEIVETKKLLTMTDALSTDLSLVLALQSEFVKKSFLSWKVTEEELEKCLDRGNSVIVKEKNRVIAYLLTLVPEKALSHTFLKNCSEFLNKRDLDDLNFCVSQVCVNEDFQGRGLFSEMYKKLLENVGYTYDVRFLIVDKSNERSLFVHRMKIKTINVGEFGENDEYVVFALFKNSECIKKNVESLTNKFKKIISE